MKGSLIVDRKEKESIEMKNKIIKETAWIGDKYVKGKIKAIVLNFHGLGGGLKQNPSQEELAWAEKGGLVVFPYYGPWSWMNREARAFVDELIESIIVEYKLKKDIPIISTGGSMGGYSSLLFTRYSKHKIKACYANCPVCDLKYHFSERPDLPATIHAAFRGYREGMEELFVEHSPVKQIENMPDIPYMIIHGGKDPAVNQKAHSDKMVKLMKKRRMRIEYIQIPEMGHCAPIPQKEWERAVSFVIKHFGK